MKNIDSKQWLALLKKEGIKAISPEAYIKQWISGFFFTDVRYSLRQIAVIRKSVERQVPEENRHHLGSGLDQHERARLFVEMLMCSEFIFKHLIFRFSDETESADQVYDMTRRISHDVHSLAGEAVRRAKAHGHDISLTASEMDLLKRASLFGVSVRYSLEAHFFFIQDGMKYRSLSQGPFNEMIADGLTQLHRMNHRLTKIIWGMEKERCEAIDPRKAERRLMQFAREHTRTL